MEECRNIDLSADFKLTGAEIASCHNSNSESMIVQRAIIGHEDFVGAMSTCFDQSSKEPPNGTRVEFRTRNGPQSEVVGRMEAAALNFLKCTVAGSQEGPLFHAQLFSLHEVPVDKIEEKLAEAVAWATDPVIEVAAEHRTWLRSIDRPSLEHRYGYRATLADDAIDNAAMATVAAHWNAWQSIVEQVIVTPALSLDGPEVEYRGYGKHTTIATGPLRHIKAASTDVRLTLALEPTVVSSVAKSPIASGGKGASKATAVTRWSKP